MNEKIFLGAIVKQLNAAMLEAAEPAIQQALRQVELEMRKTLASRLIAMLDRQFDMDRCGTDLRILVRGCFRDGRDG